MTAVVELNQLVKNLDDDKIKILVEVAKGFMQYSEEFPDDLHYINLSEKELSDGTHGRWEDIDWDAD